MLKFTLYLPCVMLETLPLTLDVLVSVARVMTTGTGVTTLHNTRVVPSLSCRRKGGIILLQLGTAACPVAPRFWGLDQHAFLLDRFVGVAEEATLGMELGDGWLIEGERGGSPLPPHIVEVM